MEDDLIDLISGHLEIQGDLFDFIYSNFKLTIHFKNELQRVFSDEIIRNMFSPGETSLPFSYLKGYDNKNGNIVYFYFSDKNYAFSFSGANFGSYIDLTILINRLIILNNKTPNKDVKLSFYSNDFAWFLSMVPNFKKYDDLKYVVDYNFGSVSMVSCFKCGGSKCIIHPGKFTSHGFNPVEITPCLNVIFKNNKIDFIFKVYDAILTSLKFLFMRKDICPKHVSIEVDGHCGLIFSQNVGESNNSFVSQSSLITRNCIPWKKIYQKFHKIFNLAFHKKLYIDHLPSTYNERVNFDEISMSKLAASFESVYNNFCENNEIHSDCGKDARLRVKKELENCKNSNTGKVKNLFKYLIKAVDHVPLSEKILQQLKLNRKALIKIKHYIGCSLSYRKIAEITAKFRNDIDHGNKINNRQYENAEKAFIMLNCLIYAMQLKKIGFSLNEISEMLLYIYEKK